MRKYLFIGLGGGLGAMLRYIITNMPTDYYQGSLPLNTLIINISGTFILALVLTLAFEILKMTADIRLGIATGFLGAFTTFSTVCAETVFLIFKGDYFLAIAYIVITTLLGIGFAYIGIITAKGIVAKIVNKNKIDKTGLPESESEKI